MTITTRNLHLRLSLPAPGRRIPRFFITVLGFLTMGVVSAGAENYNTAVLALNPVGFWPLNEASGTTAADLSGNNNNGTYQGGVTLGGAGVPNPPFVGFPGTSPAAGFNGLANSDGSSTVTLTNVPINSANVTITEWIYPTVQGHLGTTFWNVSQNAGLAQAYFNNAALGYNWAGGPGSQWTYDGPIPPVDQWSFVAMVITTTNAIFYLGDTNGVLISALNEVGNAPVNFTTGTSIGGPPGNDTSGFNGSMSDVAAFNYSLTRAQIQQLYSVGYGGIPVPPAPTSLSSASGNAQVSLTWNPSAEALGYNVKRSTTSGSETTIASVSGTSYTDTGLTNGATYYYEVSATNASGEGAVSSEASAVPNGAITNYAAGVLALNPVGFWPLNETSGKTAFDVSGKGNNGAYQAAVNLGAAGVGNPPFAGFTGGSLAASFDGQNLSWVTLTNLPIDSANVTFTAWIYPTGSLGALLWNGSSGLGSYYGNGGELGYNWAGNNWWFQPGLVPPLNQWSFVALVVTPTNAVFYMDNTTGQNSSTDNESTGVADFTSGTVIGSVGPANSGATFNGSMADVAAFDYSLTPAQVNQLFADSGAFILPPTITAQPVSHNAYTNGTTSFSVVANGAAPLSYQWWQGTTQLAGQTNAILTIIGVQPTNAGNYSVVISNKNGILASSVASLTLVAPPVAYENAVLADNPTGYWPLDFGIDENVNGSGQYLAADLSGNGNAGTYESISTPNEVSGPSPFIPNSVDFSGSGAFVALNAGKKLSLLQIGGQITMEAWVQPMTPQRVNPAYILSQGWDIESSQQNAISLISGDFVGGRDNGFTATNTSAAATNWAHVVCTYDGTNWNLYVNAALVATNADAQGASLFADPWAIGNGTSGGAARYFNGNICQVALYTNSLTPTRVAAHYAVGMYGTSNLAPTISSQPHNLREVTNTTATFTVVAVAFPLPTYQWYTVIGGATNAIGGATSAIYTTAPVQANDTGNGYFVVVSNSLGSIASEVVILTAGQMETAPGFLEADEYFGNYNIASVAFGALYPQDSSLPTPDKVEYLKTLNDNADLPNGGGERIYGWFTPPVTGNYVFFDASDDAGVLWLSTNKDPVNVYEIAQNQAWVYSGSDGATDWTDSNAAGGEYTYLSTGEWRSDLFELGGGQNAFAYATPTGAWSAWPGLNPDGSIPLTAGTPYYIELDHWQNSGGQGAAVTYKLDGNPDPSTGAASLLTGNVISATVPDNVAPVPPPLINQITISGSSVSVSGNNGLVNAQFNVLESTNLSAPLTTWTIITTQRFDQSGAFHFTNTVQAGSPQQFFMIKVPTN